MVRTVAERLLERLGYVVHAAGSGDEALEVVDRLVVVDLLLTDVRMPRISGPDLAGRVAGRRPALRVLYMSGFVDEERLDGPFVQKPFTPAALAFAVRAALDAA